MSGTFLQCRADFLAETPARNCLQLLFDRDSFVEIDSFVSVDGKHCGVVCGYGTIHGELVCAFAQDGAGMGKAQAAKTAKLYD